MHPAPVVHFWLVPRPARLSPAWQAAVTAEDLAQADAIPSAGRQVEWLAGRALLRACLAAHTGVPALAVPLVRAASGKPVLPDAGAPAFNLSHSARWLVCAVGRVQAIGVDIDTDDRANRMDAIAARYFHPAEQALLAGLPDAAARRVTFLRAWTLKEAYTKALGLPLNGARLQQAHFTPGRGERQQAAFALPPGAWTFAHWQFDRHQHLALACCQPSCDTGEAPAEPVWQFWQWHPETGEQPLAGPDHARID